MARSVYKYPVDLGENVLELPVGSNILHFDAQNSTLCIWADVRVDVANKIKHRILVVGTGQPLPEDEKLEHIGTASVSVNVFDKTGTFVWHAFRVEPYA